MTRISNTTTWRTTRGMLRWLALMAVLPASTLASNGELECGEQAADPSRIVVAGGSLVEILHRLDHFDAIVAVDRTATFPPEARALPQIGYVRDIAAEGVVSLRPTLVLGEHDMGPPEVIAQLRQLNVDLLRVPETFDRAGIEAKIRCVATAVGVPERAKAIIEDLAEPLPTTPDENTEPMRGIVLLTLQDGAPLAAGQESSGDGLLAMAGLENALKFRGWRPVSMEAMAAARPEFIVITERGLRAAGGVQALLEHPALRLTPAARDKRVIDMDGMAMLGFGPRTLDAARELAIRLKPVADRSAALLSPGGVSAGVRGDVEQARSLAP